MKEIIYTKSFKSAFRKSVRRNSELKEKIENTIRKMQEDVFAVRLVLISLPVNYKDCAHARADIITALFFSSTNLLGQKTKELFSLMLEHMMRCIEK